MRYFSVCSGIEAATVGWHRMGWEPVAFSEIEPFPAAVLKHHYPNVPNLGDMTKIDGREYRGLVDVLVGGTPCQAFSVAGLRRGLIDPRGNLTLVFAQLADDMDAPFVVWENVPGVLSSKDNAFGCFLGLLAGEADALVAPGGKWTDAGFVLGPERAVAWRVLDAQYFGLAQRRRRVFVVACPRGGADPREILFEREGLRRDTPPSREAGQGFAHDVAPCIGASGRGFERGRDTRGQDPVVAMPEVTPPLMCGGGPAASHNARSGHGKDAVLIPTCITGDATHHLRAEGFDASEDGTDRGQPMVACFGGNNTSGPIDVATARSASGGASGRLDFESKTFAVAFQSSQSGVRIGETHATLDSNNGSRRHNGVLAFAQNQMGEVREGEVVNTLNTNSNASGRNTPMVAFARQVSETLLGQGIKQGGTYARPQEAHPGEVLRALRKEIGEEAFAQWGLGILISFLQEEVLRQAVHGRELRLPARSRDWLVYNALSRKEDRAERAMLTLREAGCEGRASQGWRPSEQLLRELGAYLSKLSQPGASGATVLRDLWSASQGPGVLREALSAVQEVGRPDCGQGKPAHAMQVRRLVCEECEFLQGFPRSYTLIPWRGKPAELCPDGPRYKALGNSMAVPCMRWIGRRIELYGKS